MLRIGLDDPVLIIGAGICGLAIAQGLQKANIPYLIFNAEDEFDVSLRDWPVSLRSSTPILKSLLPEHLANRLDTQAAGRQALGSNASLEHVRDQPTNKIEEDVEYLTLAKADLRALCHDGNYVKVSAALKSCTDSG